MSETAIKVTERIFRDGVLVATPGDYIDEARAAKFGILADGTKDQSIPDAPDVYAKSKAEMRGLDGELIYPPEAAEPTAAEKKQAKAQADAAAKIEEGRVAAEQKAEEDRQAAEQKAEEDRQAAEIAAAEAARTAAATPIETADQKPGETA